MKEDYVTKRRDETGSLRKKKKDAVLSSLEKKRNQDNKKTTEIEDAENGTLCHSREMLWAAVQKKSDALRAHTRRTESKSAWRRE